MLVFAIAEFFKLKYVSDVVILSCSLGVLDQVNMIRQLSKQGVSATVSCDPSILDDVVSHRFQGVLSLGREDHSLLEKVKPEHFAHWYKWLIIGDGIPDHINRVRYDSDITYIRSKTSSILERTIEPVFLEDVFVHPGDGASIFPWASWTKAGLLVKHNEKRISRRLNLNKYPIKVVAPEGHYSPKTYNGSFLDYLTGDVDPQQDAPVRCPYIASSLVVEALNASEDLIKALYQSDLSSNNSMLSMVRYGFADMSGGSLRVMYERLDYVDYIIPIWPFSTGFTYLAERESSSNMYVEPFSAGVWLSCLGVGVILALSQRVTARKREEKDTAIFGVLATWLQQDTSAVPEGASGRWSFMVMSISAMLVHAYYTSAIVSSLMSTGRASLNSLKELGDSNYAIASDEFEYMRYLFWEAETNWTDLEYLKKKKMRLSSLYVDMKKGVELIKDGSTAYHAEYNKFYPFFNTLEDTQICKLQYLATIPEQLTWTVTTKRGQYIDFFRSKGAWLLETGLAQRTVLRIRMRPPQCRTSMLAERVKLGDVLPLLGLTALGAFVSFLVLGVEVAYAKAKNKNKIRTCIGKNDVAVAEFEYVN